MDKKTYIVNEPHGWFLSGVFHAYGSEIELTEAEYEDYSQPVLAGKDGKEEICTAIHLKLKDGQ